MSGSENLSYYRRRQQQEAAAASAATHPAARHVHEELAACYAARAGSIADIEEKLTAARVAA